MKARTMLVIIGLPCTGMVGGFIPPQRISIKSPAANGFVSMGKPVAISKTEFGNHDIVIDFKVVSRVRDPEGRYNGTVVLTIMPPSEKTAMKEESRARCVLGAAIRQLNMPRTHG